MIESIIKTSIQNRISVLVITFLVTVLGFWNAANLSVDAVPDVTNVQVSAVTSSPGLSPLEVEKFITNPIELEFNGMPKVTEIRSISRTGVSAVTVIFEDDTDIYFARQLVNERLKQAEAIIPEGYGKPELSPISTGLGDIYEFTLSSDRHTNEELKTHMKWDLAPKIRSIKGIIDVNVHGGDEKQYQVMIDPRRLQSFNLTFTEISNALKISNVNVGGGYISKGEEQIVIRGESQFQSIEDIENLPIRTTREGIPILLKQIAEVKIDAGLPFGVGTQNGEGEVVILTAMMLLGENSLEVVGKVKDKVEELKLGLPEGMEIKTFYDRSDFIGMTLKTVFTNLTEAFVLVFIILIVTLGSVKGAIIVGMAIPISMLTATIFMNAMGVVGNLMSLGALDFGLLVDGSIVMLESVLHGFIANRVRLESQKTQKDYTLFNQEIIIQGCQKVARAATFAIAIILLVYLPLMTLEGTEGRMFRPMAITVMLALGAALVYTLTTFPALLSFTYPNPVFKEPAYWEKVSAYYSRVLKYSFHHAGFFLTGGVAIGILLLSLGGFLGSEFLPKIFEGELEMDIKRLPSTSLKYSKQLNTEIEKSLLEIHEVTLTTCKMGRGDSAAEPIGTEEGTVMVKLRDRSEWTTADNSSDLMNFIKAKVESEVPSSYVSISQPIENRVNALLSGAKGDIVIKIFGPDLDKLKDIAESHARVLKTVPGSADIRVQRLLGLPLLEIKTDRNRMARFGVTSEEILMATETLRVGHHIGSVYEGSRRFPLIIRISADVKDPEVLENIPVMSQGGSMVPLGQVAHIEVSEGPSALYHEALTRRVMVETNVRGRDMVGFVNEAMEKTEDLENSLPPGYSVEWGGQFENFTRAKKRLSIVVPIALGIIFAMLFAMFGNVYYAMGVFFIVPFSAAGGVLGLFLRGLPFSIPAGVGFIAAAGISVLNGVVYASHLKNKLKTETNIPKAVKSSAVETIRAIITTVLVAVIGFLPMAISTGAGAEVQRPLAIVVIFGVLFATIAAFLLLPIIFEFLVIRASKRNEEKMKKMEEMEKQYKSAGMIALVVFSLLLSPPLQSQSIPLEYRYLEKTMESLEKQAVQNNPLYLKEKKNIGAARGDVITASLYYNPTIGIHQQFIGAGRNSGPGLPEMYATYEQPLDVSGVISQRKKVAIQDFQQSIADFSEFDRIFRLRIRQNYLAHVYLTKVMKTQEKFLKSYQELLQLSKFRAEKGDISYLEYERIELAQLEIEREAKSTLYKRNQVEKQLRILLGNKDLTQKIPKTAELAFFSTRELGIDLERYNPELRPDYQSLVIRENRERLNVELKKREAVPRLSLGGEVMRKGQESYSGFFASIPLPVFDRKQGEIYKAEEISKATQMNRLAKKNEIETEIQILKRELLDRESQLLNYREIELVKKNQAVQEKTRLGYIRGAFNLITFIEAERNYLSILQNYYELIYLYWNSLEEFKSNAGIYSKQNTGNKYE